MEDCLFCKIAAEEIPATKVYEDDEVIAFLDIKPVNPGHTLVIPKEHYANLSETPDDTAASLMRVVPHLSRAIMKAVDAPAFNLGVNNGEPAGQVIHHTHLHIMPRFEDDGWDIWHGKDDLSPEKADEISGKIRQNL
jgi:histidine triad (HIT) family protein